MYSQCPHCLTIYSVSLSELVQARGEVSCGSCEQAFDALATATRELPPEPIEYLTVRSREIVPPILRQAVLRPQSRQSSLFAQDDASPAAFRDGKAKAPTDFLPAQRAANRRRRRDSPLLRWSMAAILSLTLLAQVAWAERERILAVPTYRAWAQQWCSWLGCRIDAPVTAQDLALVSRDIRKHPNVADALLINAIISNRADDTRPFPTLELRLSDLEQRIIAMRRFQPRDYLADLSRAAQGMPANTTLPLEFEVVDPGADAVNFEFRLLPP